MHKNIKEILTSKNKPKEKTMILVNSLKNGKMLNEMFNYYDDASDAEKGTCLSALTYITKDKPQFVKDYIDFIIKQISYKSNRIKWEASEIIANISKLFPDKVVKAIPKFIENNKVGGTVVKWSSANGLVEIAKNNPKTCSELIPYFKKMVKSEINNGIKNIYIKALNSNKH